MLTLAIGIPEIILNHGQTDSPGHNDLLWKLAKVTKRAGAICSTVFSFALLYVVCFFVSTLLSRTPLVKLTISWH